jgi:hypothetical protein
VSDLEHRLAEDRMLRDAALDLFKADLALIRADLKERGVGARVADRIGESTLEMVDDAADYAEHHKGTVAATIAAIILWFTRGPIIDALARLLGEEEDDDAEPGERAGRSTRD